MTSSDVPKAPHNGENATSTGPRSPSTAAPQLLPPLSLDTSELQRQKDARYLESQLADVRNNLRTVDQELLRFTTRLDGVTTPDQRLGLKEKAKVFQDRRRALVAKEAFLLRKIDSFTRAAEVQRHEEAKRTLA